MENLSRPMSTDLDMANHFIFNGFIDCVFFFLFTSPVFIAQGLYAIPLFNATSQMYFFCLALKKQPLTLFPRESND